MQPRALLPVALALIGLTHAAHAQVIPPDTTEVVTRVGVYGDNDRTRVIRALVAASTPLGKGFTLSASVGIDSITSASVDVRASPFIDSMTSASPNRSPRMQDQRNEYDIGASWTNGKGALISLGGIFANEIDYVTIGGSLRGAYDLNDRNTTLLAGLAIGRDIISSVVDKEFERHLTTVGYSIGVAQVLTRRTAIRVRYDGGFLRGYQASPYRAVRFGNWNAVPRPGGDSFLFVNANQTEPEKLPFTRLRHAGVLELVQSILPDVAIAPSLTVSIDDWGLLAEAASLELRVARPAGWRFTGAYRFYHQGGTDFYAAPTSIATATPEWRPTTPTPPPTRSSAP
jgi:hypothetical protein